MSTIQKVNDVYNHHGLAELAKRGVSETLRYLSSSYERFDAEDRWLGAKYYGNFAGFHNNLGGELAEFKNRKFSPRFVSSSADSISEEQEAAMELRHNGYTVLGNIYESNLIDQITTRYNELIEQDEHTQVAHTNDPGDGNVYLRGIKPPQEQHFPEVSQLFTDKIEDVLKHYYRSQVQIRSYRAYRTRHVPQDLMERTEVYNNYWHCDGKTSDHIKLFVCLSDITEKDGPLHIMPKKYTKNLSKLRPQFDRETDGEPGGVVDENGTPVTLTGRPGTVMLANTQSCLHRAGVPDEGHTRDLIQFYLAPSSTPLSDNWIDQKLEGADPSVWGRLLKY
jgi:hypothetical protein